MVWTIMFCSGIASPSKSPVVGWPSLQMEHVRRRYSDHYPCLYLQTSFLDAYGISKDRSIQYMDTATGKVLEHREQTHE